MIDTFELYIKLTKEQKIVLRGAIDECIEDINNVSLRKSKKLHWENGELKTAAFKRYGILEIKLVLANEGEYHRYWLMVKVKPAIVLHPEDIYALSNESDLIPYKDIFRRFVRAINDYVNHDHMLLPEDISCWELRRIDYAFQFNTAYYAEYLYLFKKVAKQEKKRMYKNSLYIQREKYNINFYDKTQKYITSYAWEEKIGEHIIRMEIQCKRNYILMMQKKYQLDTISIDKLWKRKIAQDVVLEKINKFIKGGDYFDKISSKELLDNMYGQSKVQKLMSLLSCSLHNSTLLENIPLLFSVVTGGKVSEKQIKRNLVPALSKAGINPLLLPESWGINRLLNPQKLIFDSQTGKTHYTE